MFHVSKGPGTRTCFCGNLFSCGHGAFSGIMLFVSF